MSILVTGGAGFIGSSLIDKLIKKDEKVICLDNFNDYYSPEIKKENISSYLDKKNFKLVVGDILDKELLKRVFKKEEVKIVVHLAARAGVRPSLLNPHLYEEVNVGGTLNLLELSRDNIENFVFASSSSVYGVNSKIPFSEDDPIEKPVSPYAATKRAAELLCYTYHHLYNIPLVCLRFFTAYGPRQRPDMAIHKFTKLIDEGKKITMFGSGSSRRDYTYISDIIEGVISSLHKEFSFEVINLGNSRTVELRHLISLIEKGLRKKAKVKQLPDQLGDVPITYAKIDKAKRLLGYKPKVKIEEGIEKFIFWYKKS
ncbi:MAG: epimerase [Armatimonadetes bacterium CG07_land_8_20_14_0_80_40_9]|nr:MAG: epimerase [Armatimonadetes bacterium CG07_land_8_20_14_0_80_40_9]